MKSGEIIKKDKKGKNKDMIGLEWWNIGLHHLDHYISPPISDFMRHYTHMDINLKKIAKTARKKKKYKKTKEQKNKSHLRDKNRLNHDNSPSSSLSSRNMIILVKTNC